MNIAVSEDLLIRVEQRPGKYVVQGSELVMILPKGGVNTEKKISHLYTSKLTMYLFSVGNVPKCRM